MGIVPSKKSTPPLPLPPPSPSTSSLQQSALILLRKSLRSP